MKGTQLGLITNRSLPKTTDQTVLSTVRRTANPIAQNPIAP